MQNSWIQKEYSIEKTGTILQVFSEYKLIESSLSKEWLRFPSHGALGGAFVYLC